MRFLGVLFFCASLLISRPAFSQELVQPPQTDRLGSEKLFFEAYKALLDRRYWDAEELTDMSLSADPYNIDGYLLRALIRQNKGDLNGSMTDLRSYLEVRPRDHTAKKILSAIEEVYSNDSRYNPTDYAGYKQPLKLFFELSPRTSVGTIGLSDGSSFGSKVGLADSLADQVQILEPGRMRNIAFSGPSDLLFLSYSRFVVLGKDGALVEFEDQGEEFVTIRSGDVRSGSDSVAFLSSSVLAVSSPLGRKIDFYSYPDLNSLGSWSPEEGDLFEPRGIAARGGTLAISDRRNDRVYLLSWGKEVPYISLEVSTPRSVIWGPTGDLLVLSDNGFLSVFSMDMSKEWLEVDRIAVPEALCLLKSQDRIFLISSDGRDITVLEAVPGKKEGLILATGLFGPKTDTINEDTGQVVEVSVSLSSPFTSYIHSQRGVLSSVWQDTMKGGRIFEAKGRDLTAVIVAPENRYKFNGDLWDSVSEIGELERSVRKIWEQNPGFSQIVVDSEIQANEDDFLWLFNFCKINGVSLSVWGTKTPSDFLISVLENTGGNVYYSESLSDGDLKGLKTKSFVFNIFYPETISSSGYPSKNMLSTIADFGMISYRGWLPIWPDMLR
ncbi:hypothetical protein SAMN06275492_10191 [Dethiosulfovibrio salsuginis]|uniref:Uncharacterized protein n=2 Tax=Dethiosulfovibrio salsuginis TaxID=561720 RepID=A0A1X7I5Y8_9BACT|nr:hypothetical protein SAMN06275492_10191 [Dethiosulfovibrio salsuginis]